MDFIQLKYFRLAAHYEHMTKAAEALGITQPALTASIRRLEAELGVKLFEKNGRNVALSTSGKLFLEYVDQSLDTIDAGIEELEKLKRDMDSSFTLYAPSMRVFSGFLDFLLVQFPKISIFESRSDADDIYDILVKGLADLVISSFSCIDDNSIIGGTLLCTEAFAVVMSRKNKLASNDTISLANLKNESWALPPIYTSVKSGTFTLFKNAGYQPHVTFESGSLPNIIQAICYQNCVSLMGETSAKKYSKYNDDIVYFTLENASLNRYLYWKKNNKKAVLSKARTGIIDFFKTYNPPLTDEGKPDSARFRD